MRRRARIRATWIAGVLLVAAPSHARYPVFQASRILFEPGAAPPRHIVLKSEPLGMISSGDGGRSWQWSCDEAFGGETISAGEWPLAMTAGGRLFAASPLHVKITDDYCTFRAVDTFTGHHVMDIAASASEILVLVADIIGDGGIAGGIQRSTDGGDQWEPLGTALPPDVVWRDIERSPETGGRLYMVGWTLGQGSRPELARSDDDGASWSVFDIPTDSAQASPLPRIEELHPERPELLVLRVEDRSSLDSSPTNILATTDGGAHFRTLYGSASTLPGHALSPDAKTLVLAGPDDGLVSASLDDALARGPAAFTQVFARNVWGLRWTDAGLYAASNDRTPSEKEGFALGLSRDGGRTFAPLLHACDARYGACALSSSVKRACGSVWEAWHPNIQSACLLSADAGPPGRAGARDGAGAGCGCAVSGRSRAGFHSAGLLLVGLSMARRGTRRRASRTGKDGARGRLLT